jgi:fumarate reductase flavoprotein subunit
MERMMDRRAFVKDAALTSALAIAGAASSQALAAEASSDGEAAASAAQDASAETVDVQDTVTHEEGALAGAGTSLSLQTPEWLGEEPTFSESDITATYDCDLLIVGMGCAGSAAAATAAELGIDAICVECGPCVPETREYLGAVNSTFTLEADPEPTDAGKILNELSRYSSGKADRDLLKMWVDNSADVVEWIDDIMTKQGKEVAVDVPSDHATGGTDYLIPTVQHVWNPSYEYPMRNDVFAQMAADADGEDVLYNCTLLRLIHDDGTVTGGICDYDGSLIRINAQRTIIATGGYDANPEMMMALQPDTVACVTASSYHGFDDGSGIKAGIWAGGSKQSDPTPMIFDRGSVMPGQSSGYAKSSDDGIYRFPGQNYQLNIGSQPFLKVNRHGERFANESTPYDNMLFATRRQPGGVFCQVFDGNCDQDILRFSMIGCASYTTEMIRDAGMTAEEFIDFDGGTDTFVKADTLDELADKLGFEGEDKQTFLATCEHYNDLYDAQADSDYGKEDYRLSELRTPPFYGCWYGGSLLCTLDGLNVNAHLQVLDDAWEPISGLYAVGNASGCFFDTNYPEYIPGVAACRSVTEGRMCVKMIAEEQDFNPTQHERTIVGPAEAPAQSQWKDGTYTGHGRGIGGQLDVTLTIENGKITDVQFSHNHETPRYPGYIAIENGIFTDQIIGAQSDQIEGVTAATITTGAVEHAVRDALTQAAE